MTDQPTTAYVAVHGIDWDTDGEDVPNLPDSLVLPFWGDLPYARYKEVIGEGICDHLSNTYGWCIRDFKWFWKRA